MLLLDETGRVAMAMNILRNRVSVHLGFTFEHYSRKN